MDRLFDCAREAYSYDEGAFDVFPAITVLEKIDREIVELEKVLDKTEEWYFKVRKPSDCICQDAM